MPGNEKVLAFPVYPGVTPLDLIGPLTVLRNSGIGTRYRTVVVGERAEQLATDTPLRLLPAATFAEVPDPWAVIVPGGGAGTLAAMEDEALLSYVRSPPPGRGSSAPPATGRWCWPPPTCCAASGRRSTGPSASPGGAGRGPASERWLVDGRLHTAAGGTAGIDMALPCWPGCAADTARLAQLSTEYDPQPPFGRVGAGPADDELARTLRGTRQRPAGPGRATSASSPSCSTRG